MADFDLIAPPKTITVSFSLDPAHNTINSLLLLSDAEHTSGFGEWVYQTAETLPPERIHTGRLVNALDVAKYLEDKPWPSFTAWLDDLAARDPHTMRDRALNILSTKANETLGEDITPTQLGVNRALYLSLIDRLYCHKGKDEKFDTALYEEAHALLNDPLAMQALIVTHLRALWDEVLSLEWEHSLPLLQEAIAALKSLDYSGMQAADILYRVTGREAPAEWEKWLPDIEQLIFIPSAHIGPYLMLMSRHHATTKTARIIFGARIPEGTIVSSPDLSRAELLTRLNALADDMRLNILKLLAHEGEQSTQSIKERFALSQSSASRHLRQLTATGYVVEQRREGGKFYRLNPNRTDDTFGALQKFLR